MLKTRIGFSNERMMKMCKKRHLILLEVIIAFALVALCVLPMIYPQVFILKSEREFVDTIELDHVVNLLYADRLQKLYLNEIGWDEIEEGKRSEIPEILLQEIAHKRDFPFKGSYEFHIEKRKPPQPEDRIYLVKLSFRFKPKKETKSSKADTESPSKKIKELTYEYQIFIERRPKNTNSGQVKEELVNEDHVKGKEGNT